MTSGELPLKPDPEKMISVPGGIPATLRHAPEPSSLTRNVGPANALAGQIKITSTAARETSLSRSIATLPVQRNQRPNVSTLGRPREDDSIRGTVEVNGMNHTCAAT